jgi:hypothetical protein
MSKPDQTEEVEVQHVITHDFVLDVYEQSLEETDPDKRQAIIETAKVLSQQIGSYLAEK